MALRRARGFVLRLARRRAAALLTGVALAAPAAWIRFSGDYGAWWVEGLCLIAIATGVALLWTGMVGLRPDWHED
jgi:hypothetical protein